MSMEQNILQQPTSTAHMTVAAGLEKHPKVLLRYVSTPLFFKSYFGVILVAEHEFDINFAIRDMYKAYLPGFSKKMPTFEKIFISKIMKNLQLKSINSLNKWKLT